MKQLINPETITVIGRRLVHLENNLTNLDHGECRHLIGMRLPDITLLTTDGMQINLAKEDGITVIFCYPMTSRPGVQMPTGWDDIPGARGCTPQCCSYRDRYKDLEELGASVYGISTQKTEYQEEMANRLRLPFLIISDSKFKFCVTLRIPTFYVDGMKLMKRVTLIARDRTVIAVNYPILSSEKDSSWVVSFLSKLKIKKQQQM